MGIENGQESGLRTEEEKLLEESLAPCARMKKRKSCFFFHLLPMPMAREGAPTGYRYSTLCIKSCRAARCMCVRQSEFIDYSDGRGLNSLHDVRMSSKTGLGEEVMMKIKCPY